jgi:hypothetical protein
MPRLWVKFILYIPLKPDADPQKCFQRLKVGLARTLDIEPALDAKIEERAEHEPGWRKGQLQITYAKGRDFLSKEERENVRQLSFRDKTKVLPSFEELRIGSFEFSTFDDEVVLDAPWFPSLPSDIFITQANLVEGGFLLAAGFHHCCFDAFGMVQVMKAWSECCRSVEQNLSEYCTWFPRSSLDPAVLDRLWLSEGHRRPRSEIDKSVWTYLGFADPFQDTESSERELKGDPSVKDGSVADKSEESNEKANGIHLKENGTLPEENGVPPGKNGAVVEPAEEQREERNGVNAGGNGAATGASEAAEKTNEVHSGRNGVVIESVETEDKSMAPSPPPRALESNVFYISPKKFAELKRDAGVGTEVDGVLITANDAILAHFWRGTIRARMLAAQDAGRIVTTEELSSLEAPVDARQFFSDKLPRTYAGNAIMIPKASMPLLKLTAPYSETPLKEIATVVRRASAPINTQLVHDAYTLLKTVPDYTALNYSFMDTLSLDVAITSILLLPIQEIVFGGEFFDDDGHAEHGRPLMDGFNSGFRLCSVLPLTSAGGVKLLAGMFPEELEKMLEDEDFARYAVYMCS